MTADQYQKALAAMLNADNPEFEILDDLLDKMVTAYMKGNQIARYELLGRAFELVAKHLPKEEAGGA